MKIDLSHKFPSEVNRIAFAVIAELDDVNLLYIEEVCVDHLRHVFKRMRRKLDYPDVRMDEAAEVMAHILAPLSREDEKLKPVVTMLFDYLDHHGEAVRERYSNLRARVLGDRPIIVTAGPKSEVALKGPIRFEGIELGRKVGNHE